MGDPACWVDLVEPRPAEVVVLLPPSAKPIRQVRFSMEQAQALYRDLGDLLSDTERIPSEAPTLPPADDTESLSEPSSND